jgi:hypothetical protein
MRVVTSNPGEPSAPSDAVGAHHDSQRTLLLDDGPATDT